jgi:thymidylate synthase ThyX
MSEETRAFALAKYSRSNKGFEEAAKSVTDDSAGTFLDTFYYQYGHASIAEMARVRLGIEDVSFLAADEIEYEPLWIGQERSTRYQDYSAPRYVGQNGLLEADAYHKQMQLMFETYKDVLAKTVVAIRDAMPQPADMDTDEYRRTTRAWACDVARYYLPLGTLTSLGQDLNVRSMEQQIRRLSGSAFEELRIVARHMQYVGRKEVPHLLRDTAFSEERYAAELALRQLVKKLTKGYEPPKVQTGATLHTAIKPSVDYVASIIFRYSQFPYELCLSLVEEGMDQTARNLVTDYAADLLRLEPWSTLPRVGYSYIWEVTADFKTMQDLHRHRRFVQVRQDVGPTLGYESGYTLLKYAIPMNRNMGIGGFEYNDFMDRMIAGASALNRDEAKYALPVAALRRTLFKGDWDQMRYVAKLRTGSKGHWMYRRLAEMLALEMMDTVPVLADQVEYTPFAERDWWKR